MNNIEIKQACGGWKIEGTFVHYNYKRRKCFITFQGELFEFPPFDCTKYRVLITQKLGVYFAKNFSLKF